MPSFMLLRPRIFSLCLSIISLLTSAGERTISAGEETLANNNNNQSFPSFSEFVSVF